MAFEIQVLKIEYPELDETTTLTCKLETKETGETVYDSSVIGRGENPVFKFVAAVSHKTTLEFQIASRDNSSPCSCLTPLNFVLSAKKDDQIDTLQGARVVHLTRPNALAGTKTQVVAARVWFGPNAVQQQSGLHIPRSLTTGLSPDLKQIFMKESKSSCSYWYAVRPHPVIFVLFHSTSVQEKFSTHKITPVAHVDMSPMRKTTSILDIKGEKVAVIPVVKPVALKCSQNSDQLQLYLVQESKTTPQFSVSIPLDSLNPFQPYNMKFDQKWRKTSIQAESALDQLDSNTCVFVSVLYFPPSFTYTAYEGLEVLVETPILETSIDDDLVVCFQVKNTSTGGPPVSSAGESSNPKNTEVITFTGLMQSCEDGRFISTPAYFFVPSEPKLLNYYKLSLKVFSVKHNSQLWWKSSSHASVDFAFTKQVIECLFSSRHKQGLKYQFKEEIKHNSPDAPIFQQLDVVVRWKNSSMRFLSEQFNVPGAKAHASATNDNLLNALSHDVERLRRENKILKKENGDFEKVIMEMEASTVATAAQRSHLKHLTQYDLIERVVKLSEHLLTETELRKKLEAKEKKLREKLIKMCSLEAEFLELQRAHLSQQRIIRELQEKVVKYKQSVRICKQQDVTITKLENALCEQTTDNQTKLAVKELKMENAYLRSLLPMYSSTHSKSLIAEKEKTIVALQNEVSSLSKKLKFASHYDLSLMGRNLHHTTHRMEKEEVLRHRLALAEYREKMAVKELLAHQSQKNPKHKWRPLDRESSLLQCATQGSHNRRKTEKESQPGFPSYLPHTPDLSRTLGMTEVALDPLLPLTHSSLQPASADTSFILQDFKED